MRKMNVILPKSPQSLSESPDSSLSAAISGTGEAFQQVMGALNETPKTGEAVVSEAKEESGIKVQFVRANNSELKEKMQPGKQAAEGRHPSRPDSAKVTEPIGKSLRDEKLQTINGKRFSGRMVEASAWDKAQAAKARSMAASPGARSRMGGQQIEGTDKNTVNRKDLASGEKSADAIKLGTKGEISRADGSPAVKAADGSTKVLDAQNEDNSLKLFVNQDASDEEIQKAKQTISESLKKKQADTKSNPEAFARASESLHEKSGETIARNVKLTVEDSATKLTEDKLRPSVQTAEESVKASDADKKHDSKHDGKHDGKKDAHAGKADVVQQRGEQAKGEQNKSDAAQNFAQAAKAAKDAVETLPGKGVADGKIATAKKLTPTKGTEKSVTTGSSTATAQMDATSVAHALGRGNRTQAVNQLSSLMEARLTMMTQQNRPELHLKLTPQHLGDIHVRLISQGEQTTVRIQAEREVVGRMLESGVQQLLQQLNKAGLQVNEVNVDFAQMDFEHGGSNETGAGSGENQDFAQMMGGEQVEEGATTNTAQRRSLHEGAIDVTA